MAFYERVTKFTCELETDLILKEDASTAKPRAHPRLPKPLQNSTHLWKLFHGKNVSSKILYHALNRVFRLLHSYTRISNNFCKISYDGQSRKVFS